MSTNITVNQDGLSALQKDIAEHPDKYATEARCPICNAPVKVVPGINHCPEYDNDFEIIYQIVL